MSNVFMSKTLENYLNELGNRAKKMNKNTLILKVLKQEDKIKRQEEQIDELYNRLSCLAHKETLRECMKHLENELVTFNIDVEGHTYQATSCKDFEKYYGKKLLDNTLVTKRLFETKDALSLGLVCNIEAIIKKGVENE